MNQLNEFVKALWLKPLT